LVVCDIFYIAAVNSVALSPRSFYSWLTEMRLIKFAKIPFDSKSISKNVIYKYSASYAIIFPGNLTLWSLLEASFAFAQN